MLKDCVPAHPEIHTEYYLVFDDGHGNGFWFPCNHKGAFAKPLSPCAQRNYDDCLQNPHRFVRRQGGASFYWPGEWQVSVRQYRGTDR